MFISYEYIKYVSYDKKTKEYRYQYKITDSDFEEVVVGVEVGVGLGVGVAVIDTYEKRNLNVAANLMKAFVWGVKTYGWTIADLISYNKKYNPKFAKYEDDLQKYMVLI